MQGRFDLQMLHTPGLTQDLLDAVRREGGDAAVMEYLQRFPVDGQWAMDNLIFKTAPSYFYYQALSNPGNYFTTGYGWNAPTLFAWIALTQTSTEPSYTGEVYTLDFGWDSTPDMVGGTSSHKVFINNCIISPDFKSDPNGREAIYAKLKWLYLPGEATHSSIRSVTYYSSCRLDYTTSNFSVGHGRTGRVRIKDSGGNPVTINKASNKSLLVEYTFTMPSL